MKRLTLALLAVVVLALCSSAVDALAATGIVLAGPLNVRAGPGTSYAAETAELAAGHFNYDLRATLADDSTFVLTAGTLLVARSIALPEAP